MAPVKSSKAAAGKRNVQIKRTLSIIRDLDRQDGVDLYELAERYGTNLRTIRRDLEGLEAVGVPIIEEESDNKRKRWRVAYKDKLGKLADLLEVTHYLALRVAMDSGVGKSSNLFTALEDLADKIEGHLGAAERAQLKNIAAAFHSYEKFAYRERAADLFWPFIGAIAAHRVCRVVYRAPRAEAADKEIRILPLRLFLYQHAVYLHAYVPKHDDIITLNLQRMIDVKVLDETAPVPKSYRPDELEDSAFGVHGGKTREKFVLRFSSEVAPYIREKTWHRTERHRALADGRLELRFECSPSYEVTSWVASWRQHVEVVAPESLRGELASYGRWLAEQYADGGAASAAR